VHQLREWLCRHSGSIRLHSGELFSCQLQQLLSISLHQLSAGLSAFSKPALLPAECLPFIQLPVLQYQCKLHQVLFQLHAPQRAVHPHLLLYASLPNMQGKLDLLRRLLKQLCPQHLDREVRSDVLSD
jgi:hypothetical protein